MAAPEALSTGKSVPYGKHGLSRIRRLGGGAQAPCSEPTDAAPIRAKLDSIEETRLDCRQRRRSAWPAMQVARAALEARADRCHDILAERSTETTWHDQHALHGGPRSPDGPAWARRLLS